jgi:23S rRNA pseudouridine2457 synthase
MLSQFSQDKPGQVTLANLNFKFNKNVYPVGRLDADSEGLLILSDNKKLNQQILDPKNKVPKTYWVQVEGDPSMTDLLPLVNGITISVNGKPYNTNRAAIEILGNDVDLPERNPPIRFRKSVPDTWVSISISEGKNRQVRKMFATVNYPVLRLVRVGLSGFKFKEGILKDLKPGGVVSVNL